MSQHVWAVDVQTAYLAFAFASLGDETISTEWLAARQEGRDA